ncbi:MAG: TlpA disulfide reductase family protein [Acidobacteriota bacterium]
MPIDELLHGATCNLLCQQMRIIVLNNTLIAIAVAVVVLTGGLVSSAQTKAASGAKEIFRDSDGKLVSNNEFVDIRMANSNYPDATIIRILDDGVKEFRLQKIPQEGMSAPEFSVRTLDGDNVTLSSLRGKVVVLSFWFIACPACRAMKPHLNEFRRRFGGDDNVVFLAMTADPKDEVEKFLKKEPFDYLNAANANPAMSKFAFRGFPKNIVIDKQGKIVYWRSTVRAWDKFESVVRSELAMN